METRTYEENGINWIWYVTGEFDDTEKTATIHAHYRIHKYDGSVHPKTVGTFRIMEDENRQVYGVRAGKIEYLVLNPKHVFAYDDFGN